jgi:WD40 repeat protein/serine/threonine protein kinase
MSDSPLPAVSIMLINQRERWQRGDCVPVEELVEEQPSLRDQAGPVLELLYHEMLLTEERGQRPQLEDYLRRFPQFANEVRMQFEVHAALTAVGELTDADAVRRAAQAFDSAPRCPEIEGYELLGELGRGGMGVVYKARQIKLNRIVALKMIRTGQLAGSHELARFHHEAEVVAQLQHPQIVQIHEVGEAKGWPYLALEFVDGTSLDRVLANKPQPIEAAARLIETLARAIHYAHLRGVVHRDLKPANVLLGSAAANWEPPVKPSSSKGHGSAPKSPAAGARNQEPVRRASSNVTLDASPLAAEFAKITDFGLAKSLEPGADGPTNTGDVLGTPSYMAPEQAGGKPSDVGLAVDIYSLGAILYEMLTGRPPFVAETMVETLLLVRTQEPASPSRLRPNLPRDLVTICLTCLQKQPGRRYGSALELADDLRHFLQHEPIRARPIGLAERSLKWARRRPAAAMLIATVLLVATFGFAFVSWQLKQTAAALSDAKRAHAQTVAQNYLNQIALAHHELLAHHVGQAARLLEDCPESHRGWEWHYLKRLCQTDLFAISGHSSEARALAYSPDGQLLASGSGRWLAGQDNGELKIWDAHTGKELHTLLQDTSTIFGVAFSPDGQLLASGGRDGKIFLWNPRTGERLQELVGSGSPVFDLAFHPDGKRLAASGFDVRIWDLESGTCLHVLKKHASSIWSTCWSPDGRYLVSTDWRGEAHLWDASSGEHLRLLADVIDLRASAFSPDNKWLAAGSWDGSIWLWDLENFDAPPAVRHTNAGQIYDLAFGPEGRRLAFCARDGVKIWDLKSFAELHDFAGHNGVAISLAFSPDGSRLATGGMDGTVKIWDATVREEFRRALEANALTFGFTSSEDEQLLVLGVIGRTIKAWDATTGKTIVAIPNQNTPITAIAGSQNCRRLVWVGNDQKLSCWDVSEKKLAWKLSDPISPVTALAYSTDGTQIAVGSADGRVSLCDASTGQTTLTLGQYGAPVTGVAFHPHEAVLSTVDQDGLFRVWDLGAKKEVSHFGGENRAAPLEIESEEAPPGSTAGRVIRLAYSPDGKRLTAATRLRAPEIWDAETGCLSLILDRAVDGADCASFTADGRQLVAAAGAGLRIWNTTEQGRPERIRLAAERAQSWHKREAQQCRRDRYWFGMTRHLRSLLDAVPADVSARLQLVSPLAEMGQWDQALAENDKVIEANRRDVMAWFNCLCLALQRGDKAAYRQACIDASENLDTSADPETANAVAWFRALAPEGGGDPLELVRLAEQALAAKPGNYAYLNTLGAALYRADQHAEAIVQLKTAIQAHEKKTGSGTDWALLAMSYARNGDNAQARVWLEKAKAAPELPTWQQRVEQRVLRQEAIGVVENLPLPSGEGRGEGM